MLLHRLASTVRWLIARDRAEQNLHDELQTFLDMAAADRMREGTDAAPRIVAGESKLVTIAPDDTLCVNNVQDTPGVGSHYLCRSVFVTTPNDGTVTIEAVSTLDGEHPRLEVETAGSSTCCSERIGNPTTIQVTAGTVIVVNVEMLSSSTSTQSFVVSASPPR